MTENKSHLIGFVHNRYDLDCAFFPYLKYVTRTASKQNINLNLVFIHKETDMSPTMNILDNAWRQTMARECDQNFASRLSPKCIVWQAPASDGTEQEAQIILSC